MSLTIYTLGNIPTFLGVLNAVSMFWATGIMSDPKIGLGSAAGLGLLVTVMLPMLSTVIGITSKGSGTGGWSILLILIIVYSIGSMPMTLKCQSPAPQSCWDSFC